MDVASIPLGAVFPTALDEAITACDVLLAVITTDWPTSFDPLQPTDYVSYEITTALKRGLLVVPVLLDGVSMPTPCQLPPDLALFATRNAAHLNFPTFNSDVDVLVNQLFQLIDTPDDYIARTNLEQHSENLVHALTKLWRESPDPFEAMNWALDRILDENIIVYANPARDTPLEVARSIVEHSDIRSGMSIALQGNPRRHETSEELIVSLLANHRS